MIKAYLIFLLLFSPSLGICSFANYNNVLIGERAAGMGGAFTALTGDPAAASYYNPSTLARMHGSSLSAAINIYQKSDILFGENQNFGSALGRVNQGKIQSIPSSSGTVYTFGNFAVGISILFPDFKDYVGKISNTEKVSSYLNERNESLWVGGSIALNISNNESLGLSMYYTSESLTRSVTDELKSGGNTTLYSEEKILKNNSIIYILGYFNQLTEQFSLGVSYRFNSLEINGRGSYFQSQISTDGSSNTIAPLVDISSNSKTPSKLTLGLAYSRKKIWSASVDFSYYGREEYYDMDVIESADYLTYKNIWNINLGYEKYIYSWLALRAGVFTNFSPHPEIPESNSIRVGDHIDMWGYSFNLAMFTNEYSSITLGGYYNGGSGHSTQRSGQQIVKTPKNIQNFSFLVGTSFYF